MSDITPAEMKALLTQHDTGPQGGRPCMRCGLKHSQATAYIPCFEEGDTLSSWQTRHQDALNACPLGTINDILRSEENRRG